MVEEWLNNITAETPQETKLRNTVFRILFATGDEQVKVEGEHLLVDGQVFDSTTLNTDNNHNEDEGKRHSDDDNE